MLVRLNLFALWVLYWVSVNQSAQKNETDGISYYSFALPPITLTIAYGLVAVGLVSLLAVFTRKYIKTGIRPAMSSVLGFFSMYCWYLPMLYHPSFFYLIPFFHSLQYLLFVVAMKKNQSETNAKEAPEASRRAVQFKNFWGFFGVSLVLGGLAFYVLPNLGDKYLALNPDTFGPTFWMFSFMIFINVHHYFIDNVIWRGDNPELKKHLFRSA